VNTTTGHKPLICVLILRETRVLAANQGLLTVSGGGSARSLWLAKRVQVAIFFLTCVLIAGLFGAATASRKILYVQAAPALAALLALLI
jgi:putative membrane protein